MNTVINEYFFREKTMSNELEIYQKYIKASEDRMKELGLSPRNISDEECEAFFTMLQDREEDKSVLDNVKNIVSNFVRRGSYDETNTKAQRLYDIICGMDSYISRQEAVELLLDMKGGISDSFAVLLLGLSFDDKTTEHIVKSLSNIYLISREAFDKVVEMSATNEYAKTLLFNWANESWEHDNDFEMVRDTIAIKVGNNISTDHLSPGKRANTRTDKTLHAKYLMEGRTDERDFLDRFAKLSTNGKPIAMVGGNNFGEGSSRKSATFNLLEIVGKTIDGEPDRKEGGVLIANSIAPIFENSLIASAIVPIKADTSKINEGDELIIDLEKNVITNKTQNIEISFDKIDDFAMRKIKSGGMNAYMAKKTLLLWAVDYAKQNGIEHKQIEVASDDSDNSKKPQTITQKLFSRNRLDGKKYTEKGEVVEVRIRGVYSQDTTGPMTYDEYLSMSGGKTFQSDFVIQSLCHTCECPTTAERDTQKYLTNFCSSHGGVALKAGEGVIHTVANRFVLPGDIIVGGDSHTRSERGISFPAGSDIVAAAMKYGFLELSLDREVKVSIKGKLRRGITARDIVSMFVLAAEEQSPKGKDIYIGSIVEIDGVGDLTCDERYILTNAIAERSATAAVIAADQRTIENIKDDFAYLYVRRHNGDESISLQRTLDNFKEYWETKETITSDKGAEYDEIITIDLAKYKEPLIAKPHHPDNVATLSEVAGTPIDEVFIGSCVGGNFDSIRNAALLMRGKKVASNVQCIVTPASKEIYQALLEDGALEILNEAGAVISIPGCGLCMGNKRQIGANSNAFTTTTRNFQSRVGPASSNAYLGGSEIAALTAVEGQIVSLEKYMEEFDRYLP